MLFIWKGVSPFQTFPSCLIKVAQTPAKVPEEMYARRINLLRNPCRTRRNKGIPGKRGGGKFFCMLLIQAYMCYEKNIFALLFSINIPLCLLYAEISNPYLRRVPQGFQNTICAVAHFVFWKLGGCLSYP